MNLTGKTSLLLAAVSIVGFAAVFTVFMRSGSLGVDASVYLAGARNIGEGRGYAYPEGGTGLGKNRAFGSVALGPITHYPPLFSSVVSILYLAGVELYTAAAVINSFVFTANIFLLGFIVFWVTKSTVPSLLSSLAALVSTPLLLIHSMAWSEPLYILLSLLSLFFLLLFTGKGAKMGLLVASALCAALALLTRYIAVSLIGAMVLSIAVFGGRERLMKRLRNGAVFLAIGILPIGIWIFSNMLKGLDSGGRGFNFHLITPNHARQFINAIAGILIPESVGAPIYVNIVIAALFVLIAGFLLFVFLKSLSKKHLIENDRAISVLKTVLLYMLLYVGVLVVSISFFDFFTPLDRRILSPVYIVGIIAMVLVIARIARSNVQIHIPVKRITYGMSGILLCALLTGGIVWYTLLPDSDNALGTHDKISSSDLIVSISQISKDTKIYSNYPEYVYYYTERPALVLPKKLDLVRNAEEVSYRDQMNHFVNDMANEHAVVVLFNDSGRPQLAKEIDILDRLRIKTDFESSLGKVLSL